MKKSKAKLKKDKAFIKKISSLTIGGKAVHAGGTGCPVCGKHGSHHHMVHANIDSTPIYPEAPKPSEEQTVQE